MDGRHPSSRFALLQCWPDTGRRHQIRRHLKHIGHPLVGDSTHGKGAHNRAVAHWLNLLADLQLAAPDGIAQARETLARIEARFPGTVWAETAQSRIGRLSIENKGREGPVKTLKLGTYEQNIGLKPASGDAPPVSMPTVFGRPQVSSTSASDCA